MHHYIKQNIIRRVKKNLQGAIITKLKLSTKFPRELLYVRYNVLGIGLILYQIALDITILRLYFSNMCMKSTISKIIWLNKQYTIIESGMDKESYRLIEKLY